MLNLMSLTALESDGEITFSGRNMDNNESKYNFRSLSLLAEVQRVSKIIRP